MSAEHNPSQASIGSPLNRVDGPLKVQGRATYAGENQFAQPALIGWVVGANKACGRLADIDTRQAQKVPGVVAVLTHLNAPSQRSFGEPEEEGRFTQSRAQLQDERIRYYGFPIALVLAHTLEQARYAASLVTYQIEEESPELLTAAEQAATVPESLDGGFEPDAHKGDWESSLASATHKLKAGYFTPNQISAAMEPHTTIARYDGKTLEVHTSVQIVSSAVQALANTLKLEPEDIVVKSPFVGGGFGSKLGTHSDAVLACLGTLHTRQPVKVMLSRRQVFHQTPHRGLSFQSMQLGCGQDGKFSAIRHQSAMPMARDYEFAEATGAGARVTYAAEAISSEHRVKVVDSPKLDSTRSPGDAIGSLAFESAVDEMALQAGQDPVEFRRNNLPEVHPLTGAPFSSHNLRECLDKGAELFGWNKRQKQTCGTTQSGFGVALGMRLNMLVPSEASVELNADGNIRVRTDMTDIGTGTYTILTQIVADYFDLSPSRITVELGSSQSPVSSGSGGSFGASSSGVSVLNGCQNLAQQLCELAGLARGTQTVRLTGNEVCFGQGETARIHALSELMSQIDGKWVTGMGRTEPDEDNEKYPQYSTSAHFAEVKVDTVTGEVRLVRQLGVFSAGRILNRKTAASQLQGAMIWGASYALFEDLRMDKRDGSFINCDFAEYHFAVQRDIGDVQVFFVEQPDYKACELGSKGIGELGITGSGAAIANAVADAVGVRVREFPITPDKVMAQI